MKSAKIYLHIVSIFLKFNKNFECIQNLTSRLRLYLNITSYDSIFNWKFIEILYDLVENVNYLFISDETNVIYLHINKKSNFSYYEHTTSDLRTFFTLKPMFIYLGSMDINIGHGSDSSSECIFWIKSVNF